MQKRTTHQSQKDNNSESDVKPLILMFAVMLVEFLLNAKVLGIKITIIVCSLIVILLILLILIYKHQ